MKKFLLSGSLAVLLMPALALAAFNDVTLAASNAVLSIGGITVNLTGSGATLQSVVVGGSSFDVVLLAGSTLDITAPNGNRLAYTGSSNVATDNCNDTISHLVLNGPSSGSDTVTVTPSATLCASPVASASSGSGSGSNGAPVASGGGGGGSSVTSATTPAVTTITTPSGSSIIGTLQGQVQALLAKIAALQEGGATPSASAYANASGNANFKRDLKTGSTGADVKALQVWLNAHDYTVAASGPGSSGNETTKFGGATRAALKAFQKSVGISPAAGYFGAKTRAYITAHQ